MARNIVIQDGSSSTTTYNIGDNIQFYTDNQCFKIKSPIEKNEWAANTYYTKSGTKYFLIETQGDFNSAVDDPNTNIYIEVGTEIVSCGCTEGKINAGNPSKQYTCPACKGKGYLIKAKGDNNKGCPITGISVFFPEKGSIQEKYRVTPPGSITSILIAKEDVLRKVSSSS